MVPLLWLGMIPWSVLFRKWCVPWSPPSMPWFKSWPWCYPNSPGFLSLTNPNSHPHFKWACVVRQYFEHARSLAWSSSLVYSAQLFAIDYSLHYRHPLDKVSQAREIGIGSGGQGYSVSAANPSAIADGVLRLTSRQQIPKSKTVASTSLVFCACLARASWLFASQVTRQSGLCIDMFTRNWDQRAKVSPYRNACDILRARLVWVKKKIDKRFWQPHWESGHWPSFSMGGEAGAHDKSQKEGNSKIGRREKNMQVARGSKRRRGMREAVRIYSLHAQVTGPV